MLLNLQLIVHILINNEGKHKGGKIGENKSGKNSIDIEHIVVRG